MKTSKELVALYALSRIKGLGPVKIKALISRFKQPSKVLAQNTESLVRVQKVSQDLASQIMSQADHFREMETLLQRQLEQADKLHAKLIPLTSQDYPKLLKQTSASPEILYAIGNFSVLKLLDKNSVAIVGTRKSSPQGEVVASNLAKEFSDQNWIVVSGLARGIDVAAHRGALEAGGLTVAVVGSGVDVVYPKETSFERAKILEKGLIVSEYPFETRPTALNLRRRNKITVGLSIGLVVVQTGIKGGVYNAVQAAKEQKKPVFAVLKGIDDLEGSMDLVRSGKAKSITSTDHAWDIMKMMNSGQGSLLQNVTA